MATVFILLLLGAIFCLVGGLFLTRLTWRSDVKPYGIGSPTIEIALHPERFASTERLFEIRILNGVGALLLCAAVAVVAYDIFRAFPV